MIRPQSLLPDSGKLPGTNYPYRHLHDYCVVFGLVSIRAGHNIPGFLVGPGRSIVLVALVAALLVCNDARLMAAVYEKGFPPVLFVLISYVVALTSVWGMLLNRNRLIRTAMQVLLFSAVYTDFLYLILGKFPFSYPDAINLVNNPAYASGAISTFRTAFLLAFAATGIVYVPFHLATKQLRITYAPSWLLLFLLLQGILFFYSQSNPDIYDVFPSVYRVSGNLLTANRFQPDAKWRRSAVAEQPAKRRARHLFLVVDESVTGSALSINNSRLSTTPFLQSRSASFINFGVAAAFTNYSAGSNLAFMSGLRYGEMPDKKMDAFAKPGIFRFARQAGYGTYLLDAQTADRSLQNYMTSKDLLLIDSVVQIRRLFPALAPYALDSAIAGQMAAITKGTEATFTYVNKAGAHWPYSADFPRDIGDSVLSATRGATSKNVANYYKSVYWNVDRFWQILLSKIDPADSVMVIYTSDHGEDYASESFRIKHASIYKTDAIEGRVPLMVFDQSGFFPAVFVPPVNRYSHQHIFPTLLSVMGYDSLFVRLHYGQTLIDPPDSLPRWFETGDVFGRGANRRVFIDDTIKNDGRLFCGFKNDM